MRTLWFVFLGALVGCSSTGLDVEPKQAPEEEETVDTTDTTEDTDEEPWTEPDERPDPDEDTEDEDTDVDEEPEEEPEEDLDDDLDDTTNNGPVDTTTDTCGNDAATVFDVIVHDVVLLPYKEIDEPWDWDGDVPDWLVDSTYWIADTLAQSDVSDGWVTAADYAAEILALTDEWASPLLGGTVPPDPYVSVYAYDGADVTWEFGETPTESDAIHGAFSTTFPDVFLLQGEALYMMAYDEDLFSDDFAGGWYLTEADMQEFADCGTIMLSSGDPNDPLQAMSIEVVSVE